MVAATDESRPPQEVSFKYRTDPNDQEDAGTGQSFVFVLIHVHLLDDVAPATGEITEELDFDGRDVDRNRLSIFLFRTSVKPLLIRPT